MRDAARFFFERTDAKIRAIGAVTKIFMDPLFESAGAFALRDVDEIVQDQFAIVPGIAAHNQRVTETHAARVFGNDANPTGGLR